MGEAADKSKVNFKSAGRTNAAIAEKKAPVLVRASRTMRYVSLHHHTTFSYLDGYQLPEAHVRRAVELGMPALAVTEHGNVSSHVKLEMAATKEGVKPIYGVELYTGDVEESKRTQRKNHLTVLASTQEGYRNLLRIVSRGWSQFYYEPTVDGATLAAHKSGLVVLSGCTGSLLATSLVGGKNVPEAEASYDRGKQVAARFKRAFGDSYFLEVQAFPELENVCRINQMMERLSGELKIPLVATGDVHYTRPDENEMQMILHNVRAGNKQTLEDMARAWGYHVPLHPLTDNEMYRRLRATGLSNAAAKSAVLNTELIADRCNVQLPKLPDLKFPVPPEYRDSMECWRSWLKEGWRYRGCHRLSPKEQDRYRTQLRKEMEVIEAKNFHDYLLIVSDIVKFAKDSGIPVGPARGSAAASIACWLLRITEVNPMIFPGLVFERFIDPTRADPPDVDLDFDSSRRQEITDYCAAKYGTNCVGNIGTFTMYKSKNSLDDVARVYRIPTYAVDNIKEVLLERSSGDLRASATIEDTIEMFDQAREAVEQYPKLMESTKLEGNVKGMGVHAAGLVIANGPLTDVCAIYERMVKDNLYQVISLDKYDAERQNLVKIDILGLNTMTMIKEALQMIDMPLTDLYSLPLDDPKVIEAFKANDVVGIFQFDGRAMRSVNAELQPDNFKEICDVNALARPGPLHNNASATYIDIKKGRITPERLHPIYDSIASETNYQVVYQEQILRIVREIGGFDWTAAAYIRKIISKKLGEQEFNRQWERFWAGAQANGLSEDVARKIWGLCITAGAYAFNAAHCVSYGMLAYWTMWLKVHHPVEFYASSLRTMNEKKQLEYLRDAAKHGIDAVAPSPSHSGVSWTPGPNKLYAGFSQVRGIGPKLAPRLVEYQQSHGVSKFEDFMAMKGVGKAKIDALNDMANSDDPFDVKKLHRTLQVMRKELRRWPQLPRPTHLSHQVPYSRGNDTEIVWMGMIRHRNLRDLFESNFARTGVPLDPDTVKDPHLDEWVIMIGYDDGDELLTLTVDRWKYPKFKKAVWGLKLDHDLVLVRGIKRGFQARRAIYIKQMWVIDPYADKETEEEEQFIDDVG